MSIYSGFATRQQQEIYDQCLETVLYLFQKRLLKFYQGQNTDENKFFNLLNKLHNQMKNMENHKYLQPKSSRTFQQLIIFLKCRQQVSDQKIKNQNSLAEAQQNSKQIAINRDISVQDSSKKKLVQNNQIVSQGKSQKIYNCSFQQPDKSSEDRTRTAGSKIRKKMENKEKTDAFFIESTARINYFNLPKTQRRLENDKKQEVQKQKTQQRIKNGKRSAQKLDKTDLHKMIRESAPKLIKISRNEPRSFINNSHQQIRVKKAVSNRSKQHNNNVEEMEQQNKNEGENNSEFQQLIKGYMNKTKKTYLKSFNRRRQQIEHMLRFI